jgi:short-subunit dehydrogenase
VTQMAVVTGAGRGLGAQISRDLARAGYRVIATDIADAPYTLDVTSASECAALAADFQPDVWINCAGVLGAGSAIWQDQAVIDQVVAVNVLGVMHGTRAAVQVMMAKRAGHVINIGSLASWVPVPGETVYAATKAAVLSFTLGVQAELRAEGIRHIRLSVVCPDAMLTPMLTDILDDPAIALSFTGIRPTTPERVSARVRQVLQRPRPITSVPRWRGLQVRILGAVPDFALALAPLFTRMGRRAQQRVAARY